MLASDSIEARLVRAFPFVVTEIPLLNGGVALVDPNDFPIVSARTWRVAKREDGCVSAVVSGTTGKGDFVLMHRLIMQVDADVIVDHRDGDPLNNRRQNLRPCTHAQNMKNRKKAAHNTSGYKGVYFDKRRKTWCAQIRSDGRKRYLGSYDTPNLAHEIYCLVASELHGEFARFD